MTHPHNAKHNRALYTRRKQAGLCVRCGEPACREGGIYCERHRRAEVERARRRFDEIRMGDANG